MTDSAITVENLRVRAARKTILSIDQLSVSVGEVFAVLGPNGAGKSTLLRVCLGLQRLHEGKVFVFGHNVASLSSSGLSRLRRRIGYVPQNLSSRGEMPLTVREVVGIGRTGIAGLFRPLSRNDWQIIDRWTDRLGLASLSGQLYRELSGGEQRKTLIAQAMAQEPEMLVLDEPTTHLDLGWREQIVTTIRHLYEQTRITVILVCHELEVIPSCCKRLALLEEGKVRGCGSPEEILTSDRIASLYGPGLLVRHEHGRIAVIPFAESNLRSGES